MESKLTNEVIGEVGILSSDGLSFEVKLLGVREVAGGINFLVTPISCSGEKWVPSDNVAMEPLEIFIKNVLDVDIDALQHKNRYIVKSQYDVRHQNDQGVYYKTIHKVIEDITYTWDEIEQEGGIAEIMKQLKECYNV